MNLHLLQPVAAMAVLMGSIAVMTWSETPVVSPGPPKTTAQAPALLVATVPPIGDFNREFHVNYENPFVPYAEREVEGRTQTEPRPRPVKTAPVTRPEKAPVMVAPPQLQLPARKVHTEPVPECLGILRHGPSGQVVVMTKMGQNEAQPLAVGEAIAGWTLRGIGAGAVTFERPDGGQEIIPVGTPATGATAPAMVAPAMAPPGTPASATSGEQASPVANEPTTQPMAPKPVQKSPLTPVPPDAMRMKKPPTP